MGHNALVELLVLIKPTGDFDYLMAHKVQQYQQVRRSNNASIIHLALAKDWHHHSTSSPQTDGVEVSHWWHYSVVYC